MLSIRLYKVTYAWKFVSQDPTASLRKQKMIIFSLLPYGSDKSDKCCSDAHYNTWHCCWTWIFHVPVLKKEWYFLDSVVFFIILHGIVTRFEFFLFLFSIIVADILWKISAWLILSSWKNPVFRILPTINLPRVGVGTRNWSSV